MKKYIALIVAVLVAPTLAFAAYNDLTLQTTALLSVGGYDLAISGSSAVVESLTVGATTFSVTLENGSSIAVASADNVDFSYDVAAQSVTKTCNNPGSVLSLSDTSAGATTIVVTPSGTCASTPTSSGGSGSGGGSSRSTQAIEKLKALAESTPPAVADEATLMALQQKIIELLQQIIALLLAQRGH